MAATKTLADDRIAEFGLLIEATRRLTRLIEQSLREHHDLGMAEFEAMVRLGRSPDRQMSMSDLAGQMVLTSGGVTRLVDRLAGRRFVERVSCPSDRRFTPPSRSPTLTTCPAAGSISASASAG